MTPAAMASEFLDGCTPDVVKGGNVSAPEPETILIVEDDPSIRDLLQRVLAREGYHVLSAESSIDALSIANHYDARIDMMLSDVVMPGLSGPDLGQRVVALRPRIKLLFVSGFPSHVAVGPGAMSPRAAFLHKPFSIHLLAATVRRCLDKEC
jgi:two-component system, cell cycle sensor histidine kinase and response regulator CckA